MDKLELLMSRCHCGVYLHVNEHRDSYESAKDYLNQLECGECPPGIDASLRQEMIDKDTILDLQFYPDTPVGSYSVYGWDLDTMLDHALGIINKRHGFETEKKKTCDHAIGWKVHEEYDMHKAYFILESKKELEGLCDDYFSFCPRCGMRL